MRILFLGDYSGFHATLAKGLRRLGHECIVVSDGSGYMDTSRDIDLHRKPGKLNSLKYLSQIAGLIPKFKNFDVVQLINPCFFRLKPAKLRYFFNKIKKHNGIIGLSLAGTDSLHAQALLNSQLLRYSEYKINGQLTAAAKSHGIQGWLADNLIEYCEYIYSQADVAVSALYEYHILAQSFDHKPPLFYGGIPIDTDQLKFREYTPRESGKINILVGIKKEQIQLKGTDILLNAAKEVERRHPQKCTVNVAENLKLSDYISLVDDSDIILDQIFSYTPATNALQALAMGKITFSGAEPEFYDFIDEKSIRPIVNALPDYNSIVESLENIVTSPDDLLARISREGRVFVEKYNSVDVVTNNFLEAWNQTIK